MNINLEFRKIYPICVILDNMIGDIIGRNQITQKQLLGRVLGPSINEGNEKAQNILNLHGNFVPRCSVRRLTSLERESNTEIIK